MMMNPYKQTAKVRHQMGKHFSNAKEIEIEMFFIFYSGKKTKVHSINQNKNKGTGSMTIECQSTSLLNLQIGVHWFISAAL